MFQESYDHENNPCDDDNGNEKKANKQENQQGSNTGIYEKTEIEINNLKTGFFFKCRYFGLLYKIIEYNEDKSERPSREEIAREMKYTQ